MGILSNYAQEPRPLGFPDMSLPTIEIHVFALKSVEFTGARTRKVGEVVPSHMGKKW